jgi:hypothetical protein
VPARPTLGSDVDSTVWDLAASVRRAVLDLTGETLDPEDIDTWTRMLERYGEEATAKVFDRVLSPERVPEREPYPGAARTLQMLQRERRIGVHFVTHYWDPESMTPHLEPWLKENFGPEVGLTFTTGDKLVVLQEIGAFGVIDDRPDTLGRAADAGLWTAAMLQPWNRAFVAERADVRGFCDWREVPGLLPSLPDCAQNENRRPATGWRPRPFSGCCTLVSS